MRDLQARWQRDVLSQKPDWLSIMIGINDVWRQFDSPRQPEAGVPLEAYEQTLRELVARERVRKVQGLVLVTPFYIEPNAQDAMRACMDQYGAVVRHLAAEFDALVIDI